MDGLPSGQDPAGAVVEAMVSCTASTCIRAARGQVLQRDDIAMFEQTGGNVGEESRAVLFDELGGPRLLNVKDAGIEKPGPGEGHPVLRAFQPWEAR
ncbi:hypothetical protein [Nonomuraea sp. NPDC003201]